MNGAQGSYYAILTFDDGPLDLADTNKSLEAIFGILKHHGITAVFYLTGIEVKKEPQYAKDIVARGHIVQSHSWQHRRLNTLSAAALYKDLKDAQDIIHKAIGHVPNRLRPPYGAGWVYDKSQVLIDVAGKMNLELTGWDVDTMDWAAPRGLVKKEKFDPKFPTWKKLYERRKRPLDILMHVQAETARDLDGFIKMLKEDGCQFSTYPENTSSLATADMGSSFYYVQIGASRSEGSAGVLKNQVKARGYSNVRTTYDAKQKLYKTQVGPYFVRKDADKARGELSTTFDGAFVVGIEK